jgi:hypothetical protein
MKSVFAKITLYVTAANLLNNTMYHNTVSKYNFKI